jgi:hypothetical protein
MSARRRGKERRLQRQPPSVGLRTNHHRKRVSIPANKLSGYP